MGKTASVCSFFVLAFVSLNLAGKSASGETVKMRVTSKDGLVLREKPGVNQKKIVVIPFNAKVEVIEDGKGPEERISGKKGRWIKIKYKDDSGWAFGGFLKKHDPFEVYGSESIGPLKTGMAASLVVRHLGSPESKSEVSNWGADGLDHQDWQYKAKGVTLNMIVDRKRTSVFSIIVMSPCDFRTKKNIGVGSDKADLLKAYEDDIEGENQGDDSIVVGSIYGGLIFTIKDGRVTQIFMGAAAE